MTQFFLESYYLIMVFLIQQKVLYRFVNQININEIQYEMHLIDSFHFMISSLDKLSGNLAKFEAK